jgi:hypothetical protein
MPSCYTYGGGEDYPRDITHTGQTFTISNEKGEKLFDVVAPNGTWETYDRSKAKVGKLFQFRYKGSNSGMINAEIRIGYTESTVSKENKWTGKARTGVTLEAYKEMTTIKYLKKSMAHLLDKNNRNNLQDFYKPKNIEHGIKNIAGIHCRYFSITNHSGPTLDSPTAEFRGMGSGRKQEEYLCPVMRDGKPWSLSVDIVYSLSDVAIQEGLRIDFYKMIKDFDRMLKPTLESLKLYGDLKQY